MVDPDVIARRVLALSEALGNLRGSAAGDAHRLASDATLRAAAERWLQVAIEACIDIAYHVVAANEWTPPDNARGAFLCLVGHGMLEQGLADRLSAAAGLRNVLVHDYVDVDLQRLARVIREDLADLSTFAGIAASLIDESLP
jgi:uncharacterized protein YutE (UPF0331/DUF86 family)